MGNGGRFGERPWKDRLREWASEKWDEGTSPPLVATARPGLVPGNAPQGPEQPQPYRYGNIPPPDAPPAIDQTMSPIQQTARKVWDHYRPGRTEPDDPRAAPVPGPPNTGAGIVTMPTQVVEGTRPAANRGPAPLQASSIFEHGGYGLPDFDTFAGKVENARLRGEITDDEAEQRLDQWKKLSMSTPGLQQQLMDTKLAGAEQQVAARSMGMLMGIDRNEQLARANADAQQRYDYQTREAQQRRAEWNDDVANAMVQMNRAQEDLDNSRVDPDKWFKDLGPAARFFSAIAQAMGAFGAGLTGGPNHAAQIISDSINRDIAAQRADIETKRAALASRGNILRFVHDRVGDIDRSEAVAKESIFKQLALQVDGIAARQQSDIAKTQLAELSAKLNQYSQEHGLRKGMLAQGYADSAAAMRMQAMAAMRQRQDEEEQPLRDFMQQMATGGAFIRPDDREYVLDGVGMLNPGKEATIRNLKKKFVVAKNTNERLRDIDAILAQHGAGALVPGSEPRRQIKMLWNQMIVPERKENLGSAVTEIEEKPYLASLGADPSDPIDHSLYNVRQSLHELATRKVRDIQNTVEAQGIEYGKTLADYQVTKKGVYRNYRFLPSKFGGETTPFWNPLGNQWPPPAEKTKAAPAE